MKPKAKPWLMFYQDEAKQYPASSIKLLTKICYAFIGTVGYSTPFLLKPFS
jgi:hypothetical protein